VRVVDTPLGGIKLVEADVFGDDRGFFMETFNVRDFEKFGLPTTFVQDNHSRSAGGVLRGLHFQYPTWQGKLVRVVEGEIFDVAVDIRPGSTSFGEWYGVHLSATNKHQLYIPEGFAHGFCVLSDSADVVYKCTAPYTPAEDRCISWNDPDIGIDWPVSEPLVSAKDANGGRLRDLET
jgi:dTDP-4-dehydrorhamnose 3,5-epimerase